MTRKDNLTKQYLHCLKSCFPIYGKQEKEYLKKIELHLEEYVSFHSDASYETLVSEFGSPTTLVSDYFTSLEDEYLFRKLQKKALYSQYSYSYYSNGCFLFHFPFHTLIQGLSKSTRISHCLRNYYY